MKMKAAIVTEFGKPLVIEDRDVPTPAPGEVLVKVMASGVCHTDIHAADGDWPVRPTLPFIPGHEGAGYVAAVGASVTSLKEGDRVGIPWLHSACGCCEFALLVGRPSVLQTNTGYSVDGGYAEYALAPASFAAAIPGGIEFVDAAPILCAGVTTYKALKETEAKPGEWVVISGIGGLGHVAVQYALAMGLHVAAVDIAPDKLELARSLGAEIVINAAMDDPAAAIQKLIGGAHGVVVTAVSRSAFSQAIAMLRSRGTCTLVGLPPGEFSMPIFEVVLKRLTIRGSIVGTRKDLQEALEFASYGQVKATIETQPIENVNDVFARLKRGEINGRVVLNIA